MMNWLEMKKLQFPMIGKRIVNNIKLRFDKKFLNNRRIFY